MPSDSYIVPTISASCCQLRQIVSVFPVRRGSSTRGGGWVWGTFHGFGVELIDRVHGGLLKSF